MGGWVVGWAGEWDGRGGELGRRRRGGLAGGVGWANDQWGKASQQQHFANLDEQDL